MSVLQSASSGGILKGEHFSCNEIRYEAIRMYLIILDHFGREFDVKIIVTYGNRLADA